MSIGTDNWRELKIHKVVTVYPPMKPDAYDGLKESVRKNGILQPIELLGDEIIDGRHRYSVLHDLESEGVDVISMSVSPLFIQWDQKGSLIEHVHALNFHRRHLDLTARSLIGLGYKEILQEEIKQGTRTDLAPPDVEALTKDMPRYTLDTLAPVVGSGMQTREIAAKLVDTSDRAITVAERIKREAPDLFEEMQAGTLEIWPAERALKQRITQQQAEAAELAAAADPAELALRAAELPSTAIEVEVGQFWKLGKHILYVGRMADQRFLSYKLKHSDMNGDKVELCMSLITDQDTYNEFVDYQKWIGSHSLLVAAIVKPGDLRALFHDIELPYTWTFATHHMSDVGKSWIGVNSWWPTVLFGAEEWKRGAVEDDFRGVTSKKISGGDTDYCKGGRPMLYYTWLLLLLTDKDDTVLATDLLDGQLFFAVGGLGRRCVGVQSNPDRAKLLIDRWQKETGESVVRL